jgi:hypothetical protein
VTRLQFFTEGGQSSPLFGSKRGQPFVVSDPAGGALRTISGWANLRKHPALNRAMAEMTFHFGVRRGLAADAALPESRPSLLPSRRRPDGLASTYGPSYPYPSL